MPIRYRLPALSLLPLITMAMSAPVSAETLMDALARAYRDNPSLAGARAGQRALDETVPLEKAAGRPNAGIAATYTEQLHRQNRDTQAARSINGRATVDVPVYSGGAVRNAVRAAQLRVDAGENDLRGTESAIFSQVVAAYMDVIRDSAIVVLNDQNVRALEVNLRASSDRFEVGDVTRTDVAQSESRLALARAQLQNAQAQLIISRENYIALVGTPPGELTPPPPLPGLPDSPEAAVSVALADNPDIKSAIRNRDAARYDVRVAKARVSPRVSGFVDGGYTDNLGSGPVLFADSATSLAAGATLSIPLYQGGLPGALSRQATAREAAAIEQATFIERDTIAQVRAAFASWRASLETIESTQAAIGATDLSLRGVKAENSVGTRTILDILDAEQEALNARVQNVTARRNAYVAAFTLLAAMGHAEARDLGLDPATYYDPARNRQRVQGKFFDFDFDPAPVPVAPTTASTPAQNAVPLMISTPSVTSSAPPAR